MEIPQNQKTVGNTSSLPNAVLPRQLASGGGDMPSADSFLFQLQMPLDASTDSLSLPTDGSRTKLGGTSATGASTDSTELRKAFEDFVGQTFFAEMIKACRSGQEPSAYFHGGRAEEIFQGQLDQVLSEELSKSSADKIADPMFDLFVLKRQS